ncbi:MAG: hypothetical protein D3913_11895 [Candidatus Electrothrix sp. LOE1_4_5]|nr:hypothetical protein [Candidatus Electrothrix gigas]
MKMQEKLAQLAKIDGFAGAALLTPVGQILLKCEPTGSNIELISSLANNVLRTAEKASLDMGFGHSHFTFIHTEKNLILASCINEGKSPLQSEPGNEPGKCHIHLILLIDNPGSFGIAKLEIRKTIESLAEDFRIDNTEPDTEDTEDDEDVRRTKNLKELNDSLDDENIDDAFDSLLT